jgi:hypothetical protein
MCLSGRGGEKELAPVDIQTPVVETTATLTDSFHTERSAITVAVLRNDSEPIIKLIS